MVVWDPRSTAGTKTIYVRKAYKDLYEIIFTRVCQTLSQSHRIVGVGSRITGTPGVGKSTFLLYVAKQLEETTLEFVITIVGRSYVYNRTNRKHSEISYDELQKYISNFNCIHLYDPGRHKVNFTSEHNAYIVLFASPSQENMGCFHSKFVLSFLMPPFGLHEIQTCLTECNYVKAFTDDHTKRFDKWGGLPDLIIGDDIQASCNQTLDQFLKRVDVLDFFKKTTENMLHMEITDHQFLLLRYPKADGYSYTDHYVQFTDTVYRGVLQSIETFRSQLDVEVLNRSHLGNLYEQDFWNFICVDNYEI